MTEIILETQPIANFEIEIQNFSVNYGSGGGGATNLAYTSSPTNGIVTSDTGTDATLPLADVTNAGLLSPSEKTKLAGIQAGAEVNVNADWNSVSGDSQILNKPTLITDHTNLTSIGTNTHSQIDTALTRLANTSGTNTGDQDLSGLVPYTGATTDVDLGSNSITFDSFKVNTNYTPLTDTIGETRWNDQEKTIETVLTNGTILQHGSELPVAFYNDTGTKLFNGQAGYVSGRHGAGMSKISLARGDNDITGNVYGVITGDVEDQTIGYIVPFGKVRQIKTNYTGSGIWGTTWNLGDRLWISKTVAGQLTNIEPTAPHHSDIIGEVASVGAIGNGVIDVNIQRHKRLQDLSDVNGTALTTTGQFAIWDQTNQYFDFTANINDYQLALGFTPEDISNKENTTIDTSSTKYPTVNLLKTGLDSKQNTLVSGTNIKTINGSSILGSGDLNISDNAGQFAYFGSGIDGDVTISGSTVITLTRPMYYNNLTISGNAQILTAGFPVFVAGTLDISGATNSAGAFNFAGNNGFSGNVNGTAGVQPTVQNSTFFGGGARGGAGGAGTTTAGGQGAVGVAGLSGVSSNDCGSGQSKAGGAGSGGAGGTGRGGQTSSFRTPLHLTTTWLYGATIITGGSSGGGGGAGGGNSTNSGPGGGSGGNGGGIIAVFAKTINRSSSTVAGVFNASGGNGGGGTTTNQNNCGGSSGGGGGGGGAILLVYNSLTGTTTTNAFNVNGGNGATGGNGLGTGIGASGTDGGNAGIVVIFNLGSGTMSLLQQTIAPVAGTNVSVGTAGGAGGTGGQLVASL